MDSDIWYFYHTIHATKAMQKTDILNIECLQNTYNESVPITLEGYTTYH
jgi:hypothetical protein